jgi:hypothetical protein
VHKPNHVVAPKFCNDKSGKTIPTIDTENTRTQRDPTLYQERAVFGKMKIDPAKRAQTQNAGEVSSLQWFFSQSVKMMTDKVWLYCIRPMLLK